MGAETPVGLLMDRSEHLIVALLAVLKAGGAYVPLRQGDPLDRLRQVTALAGVSILTDAEHAPRAQELGVTAVRADATDAPAGGAELPSGAGHADRLAYVMHTSGSTGMPKGVAVTHRDVVEKLARDRSFAGGAHARVLVHSPHAFDASTYEVWVPLLSGGTAVVSRRGTWTRTPWARC
ncbi:Amino acid adenylation domain-containing protein OS=Streptomyces tendae OX=1932 GN=GUR47_35325 PE=4 SV=1 [Streptomyces tendae]